jgi:hypothetical protein
MEKRKRHTYNYVHVGKLEESWKMFNVGVNMF